MKLNKDVNGKGLLIKIRVSLMLDNFWKMLLNMLSIMKTVLLVKDIY